MDDERAQLACQLAAVLDPIRNAQRVPLASEQRKIAYLQRRIAELDHESVLATHALMREWNARECPTDLRTQNEH